MRLTAPELGELQTVMSTQESGVKGVADDSNRTRSERGWRFSFLQQDEAMRKRRHARFDASMQGDADFLPAFADLQGGPYIGHDAFTDQLLPSVVDKVSRGWIDWVIPAHTPALVGLSLF
jgi:hypothetical protein